MTDNTRLDSFLNECYKFSLVAILLAVKDELIENTHIYVRLAKD
jgi:hypothetical protein